MVRVDEIRSKIGKPTFGISIDKEKLNRNGNGKIIIDLECRPVLLTNHFIINFSTINNA